ncbi:uncharacterized protein LOC143581480 [Bidens hawaiensis]|uniref:uncharacterized protein LOC143581480 n=1 Tax=Bidens hawaiensis TaxID=980011 RepID=UPI00404B8281
MSRSTVNVSQEDVTSFLQCLRFDLKSMAAEYKCNRFGDFKQLANAALCAPDESPTGLFKSKLPFYSPEDLKRLKVGLRESTIKARERVKVFSDVLSVINKCFPSIPPRKRSRPDAFSGTQAFEQKVEERGKNVIPNKRTRTSMVDQRGLDGTLPMKKKRTVIKTDWPPVTSSVLPKPMHSRSLADSRSRLNDEFRPGAANGSMRSSIPRPEQDNTSVLHDKRDQNTTNARPFNKVNVRQDFISGTPSSTTKPQAVARGPRSGPSGVPKLTHGQLVTISKGSNPGLITSTNRKRGSSTRSPSPPVAQWADRRPQKISRTARRTNLTPLLPTNGEFPPLNNGDISENGRGFAKRFPANSPKQFKSKGDHSNVTLSESEDSGAAEIRSFGKSEEFVHKDRINGQKKPTLVGPTRKNKFLNAKHHRTTRGLASARSDKQLRNGRLGFDKPERFHFHIFCRPEHENSRVVKRIHVKSIPNLAAANAVMDPVYAFSSPFWKQMDPHFGFVSDSSVTYLKQEGNIGSTVNITVIQIMEPKAVVNI